MLFTTITTLFLAASSATSVSANTNRRLTTSSLSSSVGIHARHANHRSVAKMVRTVASTVASPVLEKRQPARRSKCTASSSNTTTSSDSGSDDTEDGDGADDDTSDDDGSNDDGSDDTSTTTTTSKHGSTATHTSTATAAGSKSTGSSSSNSTVVPSGSTTSGGVVHITDPTCGANNPSKSTTTSAGPNGEESWFNCGLAGSGWTPPMMTLKQLVYITAEEALAMDNSPYAPCKANMAKFNSYGAKYDLPPIMLMAFAMQESTCSQSVHNSAGTIGMFQLAPENCSGVNCKDLDTNFDQACKLIVQYLKDANDNVLQMVGAYNGWYKGITAAKAKKAPCNQQQNLDYLHQWSNAWMQGLDGYSVGTYKNCAGDFSKRKRSLFVPRFARAAEDDTKEIGWHF